MTAADNALSGSDNLFRLIWRIERQLNGQPGPLHRIGHDGWPDQELIRFASNPDTGFSGRDLEQIRLSTTRQHLTAATLTINAPTLTGIRGVLPAHYSELVVSQQRARAPQLRDFLDIFNHRIFSLLYRSWEKTQPAVQQERDTEDVFTTILSALSGTTAPGHLPYAAARIRHACSATTLTRTLQHFTGIRVEIEPLIGGWHTIAPADRSLLAGSARRAGTAPGYCGQGQHASLGSATLGTRVWIADLGIRIIFYPESIAQVNTLLPGGTCSASLTQLVSSLIGTRLQVHYQLQTRKSYITGTRLGQEKRLGYNSFIVSSGGTQAITLSFKPHHE
jgi:type VI secretion system protein ImpH